MPTAISPKHTAEQFVERWELGDKIEVFIARVEGWQLDVAQEMEEKDIANREVAILILLFGFFEMMGKYSHGYLRKRKSEEYFKKGLRQVFPDISPRDQGLMKALYSDVRCGLFHVGRPSSNMIIQKSTHGSIGYNEEHHMLMINPSILVSDLRIFFEAFSAALRNPKNIRLRQNFQRRFDHDNESKILYGSKT